jgi:RNA polymerase sigma-70 factor (ECF subfamily)
MNRLKSTGLTEDDALVLAAQNGNRSAFRQIYDLYAPGVYRVALRLLDSHVKAQDVTQDVFVSVYRSLHSFDQRASFKTWLHRIAINSCYDRMRKQKRRSVYSVGSLDDDMNGRTTEQFADRRNGSPLRWSVLQDARRRIEIGITSLHPDLRAAFVLKEFEGLSYAEIADVMSCSEGTVASRLARARMQLAKYLRSIGIDESYISEA